MTRWIKCPGCPGEIGVPEMWEGSSVTCPNCRTRLTSDGEHVFQWRASPSANPETNLTSSTTEPAGEIVAAPNDTAAVQEEEASESAPVPVARDASQKSWMPTAGTACLIVGGLAAASSYYIAGRNSWGGFDETAGIVAAILNPLTYLVVLGWYWLNRPSKARYCPRCNQYQVGGLAGDVVACPHCSRPHRIP